ncbi:MED16 [Mytilus edulis]|uniref:Mediator of RNA polymerase II transcription subunit 16 n=1 Tax=Mytilus edulis TaxID=6550 RepID=A0A8S3PSR5_MYTED|nr:MED16 [Mytilus edulis]
MELVYTVDCDVPCGEKDWISEKKTCCSLSPQNFLAFSTEITVNRGDTPLSTTYEVKVIDLDRPWDSYIVTDGLSAVTCMIWDRTGHRLLLTTVDGCCSVWLMEDFLVNKWKNIGKSILQGEEILSAIWFHSGVQVIFNPDKKDTNSYMEKFQKSKSFSPTLTKFGGKAEDGWLVLTATGLVQAGIINQLDQSVEYVQECLGKSYNRLNIASMGHTGNGDVMIATTDGQLSSAIQCHLVSLSLNGTCAKIEIRAGASLHMKSQIEYGSSSTQRMMITNVEFINMDSSDTLILCCGSHGYSCMEVWQLLEQHMPLNKLFPIPQTQDAGFKIPKWMHKATIQHASYLTSIANPRLPMILSNQMEPGFSPYIAVSYRDGSIKFIHRFTHQVLQSSSDILQRQIQGFSPSKRQKTAAHITNLIQTLSGCGLIAVHDGQISVLKVYNVRDVSMTMASLHVCLLLEYAMITGQDWWDILLAVKPGMIENICQKLTETHSKQAVATQEVFSQRLLALKMALYCCSSVGHQKATDCHTKLVLLSLYAVFKALLRPKNVTIQDVSPSERLNLMCLKSKDGDLESLVVKFEVEEFLIDTRKVSGNPNVALQSIQPLIQWVADFTLHLLASIPLFQSYNNFPGASLLSDNLILNILRELIIVIRIWGIICPSCQPVFTTASTLDCLPHLFKLLTKAWLCCKENVKLDLDEELLDECLVLPSKMLVPGINQSFRLSNEGYSLFLQQFPQMMTLDEEPDYLYNIKKTNSMFIPDGLIENHQHHDIVRQIHLGVKLSSLVRQCCRCGAFSLLSSVAKSSIMKAWEQRWQKSCLCGGHWKLHSPNTTH